MLPSDLFLLEKEDFPVGAKGYLYKGNRIIDEEDGEKLQPLILFQGGVPPRLKWYPFDQIKPEKFLYVHSFDFEAVDGYRLFPIDVHIELESIPERTRFAVFVNSKWLGSEARYSGRSVGVSLGKATGGKVFLVNSFKDFSIKRDLPDNAVFVETGEISLEDDFRQNGWYLVPKPELSVRKQLESYGCIFHDYSYFSSTEYFQYIAVDLPKGWTMKDSGQAWSFGVCYQRTIFSEKRTSVAIIDQNNKEKIWKGEISLAT